jgi:FPC/CPF motif-containing protein YcgG
MNVMRGEQQRTQRYVDELTRMVDAAGYPCVGAKAVVARHQLSSYAATDIRQPQDDRAIAEFLNDFIDRYRRLPSVLCSAAVIFDEPQDLSEPDFEKYLWQRLQALADIDAETCAYDIRVSNDPTAKNFGFSIHAEALYVIGLHPGSSRRARRFPRPAIIFNPHAQFELLRERGKYDVMKRAVRQRDQEYSGSVNPMLADFGMSSEAVQYSGMQHGNNWKCPFASGHHGNENHSSENRRGIFTETR